MLKKKIYLLFIVLGLTLNLLLCFKTPYLLRDDKGNEKNSKKINTSQTDLPDKVYTFLTPTDIKLFENLELQAQFIYFIYIELVMPRDVSTMRIRLWDPDNKQYDIFESEMFFNPSYGRYFEIPFGTAIGGNYSIEFYVEAVKNVNIHIMMEKGPKCLFDKLDLQDPPKMIFYQVKSYHSGMSIEHNITLETDIMYRFYIGRVSAISINESNIVLMDYKITNPNEIEFDMYNNATMQSIDGINGFNFGTATSGIFNIRINIYCIVPYVNIAYTIIKDYQISDIIEPNQTNNDPPPVNNTISRIFIFPMEWTIGIIIFGGGLFLGCSILIHYQKRQNSGKFKPKLK